MKDIFTFVDAGTRPLRNHQFVSAVLNEKRDNLLSKPKLIMSMADKGVGDSEADIQFRLNATGNIFTATTGKDGQVSEEAKALFKSVTVLFSAMTKAMHEAGKDLFDYDAWTDLIGRSGYFVEMAKFQQTLEIKSGELSIDTQVVAQLLPGLTSGSSMEIAKSVLTAMNGKFGFSETDENTKFAHLLFINEEIMGSATVTIRLFFASKKSHVATTESPCHKTTKKTFSQSQEANTFLFVDPDTIAEYAKKYDPENEPESYGRLIDSLIKHLSGDSNKDESEDSNKDKSE